MGDDLGVAHDGVSDYRSQIMKPEWILVANSSLARLFSRDTSHAPLVPLTTLQHPQSRMKGSELQSDRGGHADTDRHVGGTNFSGRTDPHRKEHAHFAHQLADYLELGLNEGRFKNLSIFASSPFLGELKAALSPAVQKSVAAWVDMDLTSYGLTELEQRIAAHQPSPSL